MWIMTMTVLYFERFLFRAYRMADFQAEYRSAVRQRSRPAERQARLLARSTRSVDRGSGYFRHPGRPRLSVEGMAGSARWFFVPVGAPNRVVSAFPIFDHQG